MASTSDLLVLGAVISVIVLAAVILLLTRNPNLFKRTRPAQESTSKVEERASTSPLPVYATVSKDDVQRAEEDLRILSIEKEIVSYALTRLYEAQAEGKITENDKEKLLGKYKDEMGTLEKSINDKQMVVRLHELEATQADLVKLFQEKFGEINRSIENIRSSLGLGPQPLAKEPEQMKEAQTPEQMKETPKETSDEVEAKEKLSPKPRTPSKSKAEEKVETIQQEVLKILERLEKQEAEG